VRDRVPAPRVALGTAVTVAVVLSRWAIGHALGGTQLAQNEEAQATASDVALARQLTATQGALTRDVRRSAFDTRIGRSVGAGKTDRHLDTAGPEQQLEHVRAVPGQDSVKALEFLVIVLADDETPLLFREEASALLQEAAGERFGYDPGPTARENQRAIARICDRIGGMKRGRTSRPRRPADDTPEANDMPRRPLKCCSGCTMLAPAKMTEPGLTPPLEDYLEVIGILCRDDGNARVKDIAALMKVSNPSVVRALQALKRRRLVSQQPYGFVRLTGAGAQTAAEILHRHDVLTDFLQQVLGLDAHTASRDACRIEHAVSAETVRRVRAATAFVAKGLRPHLQWRREFGRYYARQRRTSP
jgi:DtxR family Mn-dependent transcriptional regulator